MGGGDREIEEGNETTEKRAKTIEQWTRPRRASESRNGDGDGSSERSTSRNGDETIDGATYDAIVMLLRLSVSKHARLGASESKEETTEGEGNDAVVASLGSLSNGDSGTEEDA